ncbi:hypothetical protein X808_9340 [Mannheimia varigena USDA-ARS-USMARC-1296]|uniref:Uncharacterized protein n=1 Tax=Mannheimia varigena USDA-ARS-USMARC-1296 TaxID=1433287 RepID=W0QAY7_9PAST|nr:hypothetical protein [Mannheimia varigena]AHG75457.1 hypothetical protein X808_9340 [Mannheimia varigena USDA-ARS-USMARC-1296]
MSRATKINWSELDWSKSTLELSKMLNVAGNFVSLKRRKYAPNTVRQKKAVDWSAIDWSKSTSDIAKQIGWSVANVSQKRKKYAPDTMGNLRNVGKYKRKVKPTVLKAPNGDILYMDSIKDFVIEYAHLFEAKHLISKNKKSGNHIRQYCLAESALSSLRQKRVKKWQGWSLYEGFEEQSKLKRIDWDNVDWTKNNDQLAKELNRAYDTVAKKRYLLGKSGMATSRKEKADKGQKNPKKAIGAIKTQPIAKEWAKKSQKSGKFETNVHAKRWRLTREDGKCWEFTNLYHFVRTHTELFLPNDTVWKRTGGKRGTGGEYCNATSGLLNACRSRSKKWKGWKIEKIEN